MEERKRVKKKSGANRPDSKYAVIVKVACDARCADKKCKLCRFRKFGYVRDLKKLAIWLDANEPLWRWINVYNRKTRVKYDVCYTKNNPPRSKDVEY